MEIIKKVTNKSDCRFCKCVDCQNKNNCSVCLDDCKRNNKSERVKECLYFYKNHIPMKD